MLFIIAFLLISPIKKKKEIEQKAEYVVTVVWPNEHTDDVDTWLEDPAEKLMSFRNKEIGLLHLDRDDLGHLNDTQFVPGIGKTFAELSSVEKNKISHRGIALQKLRKILINVLK